MKNGRRREEVVMTLCERDGPLTLSFSRRRIGNPEVAAESSEAMAGTLQAGSEDRPDAGVVRQERLAALTRRPGRLPEIGRAMIAGQAFDETTLAEPADHLDRRTANRADPSRYSSGAAPPLRSSSNCSMAPITAST
ncbi:MAG: hypothetical protein Q9Q40_07590 [Acidobacteriota bacterium]|nr:hypothetical protein [Acidobacteriota bacterium]